jgi:cytochrome o ubiquinol oxidase subunit 2
LGARELLWPLAVLDPQGPIGIAEKTILIDSLAIMLAIVVPTIIAIFGFAWWFRSTNKRARYLPEWGYSGRIELIVWAVPLLVIILLGGVAWIGSHQLDPGRPVASDAPALDIQVVSLDWKWLFLYPEQRIASVNHLVVPAGVPLHFFLTSASVMNAFFVPALGSMIYTMNGMTTELNLLVDRPGIYHGLSSHFSGDGFAGMSFEVEALPGRQFDSWVTVSRGDGPVLDATRYGDLSKQSMNDRPVTYRNADPTLFQQIITRTLAPGPGPNEAMH